MQSSPYERRRLKLVADCCTGRSVLDLGYAQLPNPYLAGRHRIGLDLDRPKDPAVRYEEEHVGDVMQVGRIFAGRTFDSIICGELIEHLKEPYGFLEILRPLIADGGRLVLSTPNPFGFPVVFFELANNHRFFYTTDHVYYFPPRWVHRMLDFAGYDVLDTRGVGLWLPGGWLPVWPKFLSYQMVYVASVKR